MRRRASVEPKEVAIRRSRMASASVRIVTNAAFDTHQRVAVSGGCTIVCAEIVE